MKLPSGYLTNPQTVVRHEDGTVTMIYDVKVAPWRVALEVVRALCKVRVCRRGGRWIVSV